MSRRIDIGIIGAMENEVRELIGRLADRTTETVSGIEFNIGEIYGKRVVIARCGVGKVFAAICAEAMIIKYDPALIVNTGVAGAVEKSLRPLDIVFADKLVQHDMDTSPLGDPVGLISGINRVYFETDRRALEVLSSSAKAQGVNYTVGTVATGDRFIAKMEDRERIATLFGAAACEMEGGAIAHTAFVNGTPFAVVRAISDSADGEANLDFPTFLPLAVKISTALTLALIEKY